MPDPSLLLRILSGETVFGLEIDSRVRQAANGMSALALVEIFRRCDDTRPDWRADFAESLAELTRDPDILLGFGEGRRETDGEGPAEEVSRRVSATHYLKLNFSNEDAAYYQFPLFPAMDEPFLAGGARKREGAAQHVRVDGCDEGDLQRFIEGLRSNPHLVSVEESTEEVFWAAASHAV